jgi:H/ACA ribonucleoprotein complex subunit 2
MSRHLNRAKKLRRGVKDVVKAIKKGEKGICILAADVSPVDVISHIPVLCEENHIPYIYVRSRMELGIAAETKKPTSVTLMLEPPDKELKDKYDKLHGKINTSNPYL